MTGTANAALGHAGVLLGLGAAVVGIAVIAAGIVRGRPELARSGRLYAPLMLAGAVLATIAMERALLTHDFSIAYVAANGSRSTPTLYTVTGLWSALAGSILLWGLVLSGYVVAMVWRFRRQARDPLVSWATLVTYVVAAFFFALMAGPADPFRAVSGPVPADGLGPNVLLQDNPLVAFHPPMLYLGFVGFTIPFAFAVASLVTGRIGEGWLLATRRWTLFAWGFLTVGIVLGAWWSYQVLGWGGFWAWDPVENASFLPWLCATAYLHSVLVQERRGLLRVWNLSLLVATFALTILGTFLTRSGVIESVHAFSDSDIGPLLLGFFGLVLAVGVGLIAWRGDRLRSPGGIDSPVSREGAFLVNNLLFVGFAFVVLLGTVFPLLYEALRGAQVSVGRPYFDTMTLPFVLALLFLMAIGPALPWRKADMHVLAMRLLLPAWAAAATVTLCVIAGVRGLLPLAVFGLGAFALGSNVRQLALATRAAHRHGVGAWQGIVGRANGGLVVHVGVVVIAVAIAASSAFGERGEVTLLAGTSARFAGHRVTFVGFDLVRTPARQATEALVKVDGAGPYRPAVSQFGAGTEAVGTPAIASNPLVDVYLTIDALPTGQGGPVVLGVTVQPLVVWLWVGGAIVILGALLAAIPGRRRRATDPVSAPLPAVAAVVGHADVAAHGAGPGPDPDPALSPDAVKSPGAGDLPGNGAVPRDEPVGVPGP
jgi:cytochrome c-type biogenesis protein CcmF